MKIAASNIAWRDSDDKAVLDRMHALGYSGVEIAPTRIAGEAPYAAKRKATDFARRMSIEYGFSVPSMQSIWRGRTENIFNVSDRNALISYTDDVFEFAQSANCKNIVFGCPRNRRVPEGGSLKEADSFFIACAESATRHGVTLALEANPVIYDTNFLNTTAEAYKYLEHLEFPPGLSINLDIGTMLYNDESVEDVSRFLHVVSHVHISEPFLATVVPRPIHADIAQALADSNYHGFVSLEMGPCDKSDLLAALEYIVKVFQCV